MTKDQLKAQAEWFAAFGEPTRLGIVRALVTGGKIVRELSKSLKVELVNVSHHLMILRNAGMVKCDRHGRFQQYSLLGATATAVGIEMTHESGAKITLPLN